MTATVVPTGSRPSTSRADQADPQHSWLVSNLAGVIVTAALALAVLHACLLLSDYRRLFVHPEWHFRVLPETLREGLTIGLRDVIIAMRPQGAGESRPRWLTYLISGVDQKLRLWLYSWLPVHPTFAPVAWLLQIVVTPVLLYRLLMNLTASRVTAVAGLAVYLSSIGFLSGLSMLFLAGKTLGNTVFIAALYAASEAVRRLEPGQLLVQARGVSKYALLLMLFVGLFIDELPIVAFLVVPCFFWRQYVPPWPWSRNLGMTLLNGLFLTVPAIAFLLVVVFVAPPILASQFGFTTFDYLGETLMTGANQQPGTSLASFVNWRTFEYLQSNVTTLLGLSLVPWSISPLVAGPGGSYPAAQVTNVPKIAVFVGCALLWALAIIRARGPLRAYLIGLVFIVPVVIVLLTLILVRHVPMATGYYYGSGFACLFAIIVSLMLRTVPASALVIRPLAALGVLWIVGVQIANFAPINDGWIVTHNGDFNQYMMTNQLSEDERRATPLTNSYALTPAEVSGIWAAWKRRELDTYLRDNGVSSAAAYVVFELRQIDTWRPVR